MQARLDPIKPDVGAKLLDSQPESRMYGQRSFKYPGDITTSSSDQLKITFLYYCIHPYIDIQLVTLVESQDYYVVKLIRSLQFRNIEPFRLMEDARSMIDYSSVILGLCAPPCSLSRCCSSEPPPIPNPRPLIPALQAHQGGRDQMRLVY